MCFLNVVQHMRMGAYVAMSHIHVDYMVVIHAHVRHKALG